jgi:hypothetical protein
MVNPTIKIPWTACLAHVVNNGLLEIGMVQRAQVFSASDKMVWSVTRQQGSFVKESRILSDRVKL